MADENKKPDGSSTDGGKEEEQIPISRLRDEVDKRKEFEEKSTKLEEQLRTLQEKDKTTLPDKGREDEKSHLRELISQLEEDKEKEESDALKAFDAKVEELKTLDPTIDEKALLDIIEKYELDSPDKAYKIYQDLKGGNAPVIKPKLPSSSKTTDDVKAEEFEPSKVKSTWEAVQQGLKKFGL